MDPLLTAAEARDLSYSAVKDQYTKSADIIREAATRGLTEASIMFPEFGNVLALTVTVATILESWGFETDVFTSEGGKESGLVISWEG